jgi:hypothetical protein
VTTTKLPDPDRPAHGADISSSADDWIRVFVKLLEDHFVHASSSLRPGSGDPEYRLAAARAILATYLESGMELESILELFGRAAVTPSDVEAIWSDGLNQRRFALIDKEIQGTLTPAESIELARLTTIMRDHVESEKDLPMEGARALHWKLMQFESMGESD